MRRLHHTDMQDASRRRYYCIQDARDRGKLCRRSSRRHRCNSKTAFKASAMTSLLASAAAWLFLITTTTYSRVSAHGYLKTPRSRNLVAFEDLNWETYLGGTGGTNDPLPEDCPHCLNRGGTLAQCGIASDIRNYDQPLNVRSRPMSPNVQSEYGEGDVIEVEVLVSTHHKGHFEFSVCPISADSMPMEVPTAECFAKNKLLFVSDELYHAPMDANYPERAYLIPASRAIFIQEDFYGAQYKMKFKLPDGIYGDVVLLQWYYLTANSCKHKGYTDMVFPEAWGPDAKLYSEVPDCVDIPDDGNGVPEQFWNCAEIKIARRLEDSTNEYSSPTTNDKVGSELVTLVEAPITTLSPTEAGVTPNPTEAGVTPATTPIPTVIPMTFPTLSPSFLLEEVPVTNVPAFQLTTFDDVLEQIEQSVKASQQQSQLRPPKQTVNVLYDRWNYDGEIEYVKETYVPTVSPTVDQIVTTISPTVMPTEVIETSIPTEVTVETAGPTSLITASSTPGPSKSSFSGGSSYASSFASSIHDKTSDQSSLAMMFASKPMDDDDDDDDDDTSEHPTSLPTLEPDEGIEDYIMIETSPSVVEYGENHRPTKQKGEEHQQLVNSIKNQIQQHLVKQKTKRARQKKKTKRARQKEEDKSK